MAGVANAERETLLLAEAAFGLARGGLSLIEADEAPEPSLARYEAMVERRLAGEPVARIIGRWEFYGLDFELGPDTLVPRPETELLVDIGLAFMKRTGGTRLLDLGTGTGAIAISLLVERPHASGVATDLSAGALAVARGNAARLGVLGRLELRQGSWFEAVEPGTSYDLIVSNPPYIETTTIGTLQMEVREHDPLLALDGGPDGLDPYRVIAAGAGEFLRPGGMLAVEIGHEQGESVAALFGEAGFGEVAIRKDLSGLDRVVMSHHL